MIFKKKLLLLTFLIIIICQTLLYTNNTQKTSFRFFNWTFQEVNIGKLISISFFSGLFISTFLNTTVTNFKKNSFENKVDSYEPLNFEEEKESNIEMPPQRDIRDAQPTISVNYRVVKNTEQNYSKKDQNYSKSPENQDDWVNDDNDW